MGAPLAINLARAYDVLISCLLESKTVKYVLFDDQEGLARHLKRGALVIDTSTIAYGAGTLLQKRLKGTARLQPRSANPSRTAVSISLDIFCLRSLCSAARFGDSQKHF